MAKKPKVAEAAPVTEAQEAPEETKQKRVKIDFRSTPFVIVMGGSPKILCTQKTLGDAIKFVSTEVPVSKQAKAFIGQFFPVKVEVETKVKLDVFRDD